MPRETTGALVLVALLVGAAVGGALAVGLFAPAAPGTVDQPADSPGTPPDVGADVEGVSRFESPAAFRSYVRAGQRLGGGDIAFGGPRVVMTAESGVEVEPTAEGDAAARSDTVATGATAKAETPSRIGTTNVQVAGLDEPDLVKAGERTFYYAPAGSQPRVVPEPTDDTVEGDSPPAREGETHVVDVSDPAAPATIAAIDESGRLLRSGDTLVVLAGDHLQAYDVSDPASPTPTWSHPLNASLVTARQRNGTLYLVTKTGADPEGPCPLEPLGGAATVACEDVYHPRDQIRVDATYTALSLDAASGTVRDTVSFVGTARDTVVYVSHDALYVTYTERSSRGRLLGDYALSSADLPEDVRDRIREIRSYDISARSTAREIRRALEQHWESLPSETADRRREAFREGFEDYLAAHQRDLVRTGVVRVGIDGTSLAVQAAGEVPGRPLNQFSLSQYNGTLRLTTTVPQAGSAESANDLYVLDAASLDVRGQVQGMGLTERVYSVRYVEDTAYVVTYRRVDPFHVVDLSDPTAPTVEGKLKLPGFSSYLHSVDDSHVLGIGEEDGEVKAVLFDVSDPTNPTVADDLHLAQDYSAIARSHHAFTIDRKHGVFFLPAGDEGHVVDYTDGQLSVETTVETPGRALRARYVGDYLYVFGREGIVVLDERTWDRETTLSLPE